jgi:hypothetical protein
LHSSAHRSFDSQSAVGNGSQLRAFVGLAHE